MVKFVEVSPEEVPNLREGRRGRVSYPILKGFLETGYASAKLDRTGMQQSLQSLNSSLNAYIRSHELPIKITTRSGEIYLIRLDLDEAGNPKKWDESMRASEGKEGVDYALEAVEIDDDEVEARYLEEKDLTTK